MRTVATCVVAFLLLGQLGAQTGPVYNQNGLHAHNNQVWADQIEFPNYRQAGGNQVGDCIWKVFPGDSLLTLSGVLHLSGIEVAIEDINYATALDHPDFNLYQAKKDTTGKLVPNFGQKILGLSFGNTSFPKPTTGQASGVWLVNWSLGKSLAVPVSDLANDRPLAACLMATPGENHTAADGAVFRLSAGENYTRAPQGSFSGCFDSVLAKTILADGTWKGPIVAKPYPSGENWLELAFTEPILQPWCTSSRLTQTTPMVRDLGIGSIYSDLPSATGAAGLVGWRLETWRDASASNNHWPFLLLNLLGRPTMGLQMPGSGLAIDPREPALMLLATLFGSKQLHKPQGFTSDFWDGVYATSAITFPREPAMIGYDLWASVVMVDLNSIALAGTSNTCVIRLR